MSYTPVPAHTYVKDKITFEQTSTKSGILYILDPWKAIYIQNTPCNGVSYRENMRYGPVSFMLIVFIKVVVNKKMMSN